MQEEHGKYLEGLSRDEAIEMFLTIAHKDQWPTLNGENIDPLCILALMAGVLSNENLTAGLVIGFSVGEIQAFINAMFIDLTELKDSLDLDDTAMMPEKIQAMWDKLEAWNGKAITLPSEV